MQDKTSESSCLDLNPREWIGGRVDKRPVTTNKVANSSTECKSHTCPL